MSHVASQTTGKIPAAPLSPARRVGVTRRRIGLSNLDGRSLECRRARQIAAELAAGFGKAITKTQRQACERAGLLCVVVEDLASRRLAGEPVGLSEVLRAEGVAKRACRAIEAAYPARPHGADGPLSLDVLQRLK